MNGKDYLDEALRKLKAGLTAVRGSKESAMKNAVCAALEDFCLQDEEFAQAVVQGGNFADCMTAVAKGVGGSISDLEAYTKAVRFYFPGAEIRVQMTIDLAGEAGKAEDPAAGQGKRSEGIILDFADFL